MTSVRPDLAVLALAVATGAAAQTDEPPVNDEARTAFREAAQRYNAGEFERAAELFEQAYELSHRPNMLFNIAQAYRLAGPGQCRKAYEFYDRYLREVPNPPNRSEVEERLAELAPCAPKPEPGPAPVAAPAPAPPSATHAEAPGRAWPTQAIFLGGGTVLVLGALLFGGAQAEMSIAAGMGASATSAALAPWRTTQAASYVILGVGALALVAAALSLRF
jgi:tetratricopeptide (TPR) repeat protein